MQPTLRQILDRGPVHSIEEAIAVMSSIDAALPDSDGVKWFNRLYLRVTVGEIACPFTKRGDLGRANEGKIHRPEEDDQPLARVAVVGDLLKLFALVEADDRLNPEAWQLVTNGQHDGLFPFFLGDGPVRAGPNDVETI